MAKVISFKQYIEEGRYGIAKGSLSLGKVKDMAKRAITLGQAATNAKAVMEAIRKDTDYNEGVVKFIEYSILKQSEGKIIQVTIDNTIQKYNNGQPITSANIEDAKKQYMESISKEFKLQQTSLTQLLGAFGYNNVEQAFTSWFYGTGPADIAPPPPPGSGPPPSPPPRPGLASRLKTAIVDTIKEPESLLIKTGALVQSITPIIRKHLKVKFVTMIQEKINSIQNMQVISTPSQPASEIFNVVLFAYADLNGIFTDSAKKPKYNEHSEVISNHRKYFG